ncbi:MAG: ribonuclease H-like YkuK family protein [Parcubacteria group bacterium]|nr:ribonuclease H-like YkuK family protein [Parcubacteria group bacterium]
MRTFFSSSLGMRLDVDQMVRVISDFINEDKNRRYKVIIGTDSEKNGEHGADFVTAVVVRRVGNGGRYFWRRVELDKIYTMRDRIIREVLISLDAAKELLERLNKSDAPEFDFEIHADVGENGATKAMIQEIVGMIRANNFEAKTKPESYAASSVADRHV